MRQTRRQFLKQVVGALAALAALPAATALARDPVPPSPVSMTEVVMAEREAQFRAFHRMPIVNDYLTDNEMWFIASPSTVERVRRLYRSLGR